jgi:starch-binding outer membrane protein, SusD/RagB family
MKNKIFQFLIIVILLVTSCKEQFITRDNDKGRYTPNGFFVTKAHAQQALNAAYDGLNQWANGYVWFLGIMHFVLGDDLYETGYAAGFSPWGSICNFDIQATMGGVSDCWNGYYNNILWANTAIEVMPAAQKAANDATFTQDVLNTYMGQAYFLRAFMYYNLAQYYGDDKVIIRRTVPKTDADFAKAPAPADSTKAFIIADLKKAEALLTNGLNNTAGYEKGRATRGSAAALLGKFYINHGMYAEAAAEFKKILPGVGDAAYGSYSLVPNFRDNFKRTTKNNAESVFEIQFQDLNQQGGWGNNDVNWLFQNWTLNRTSWAVMWWNFGVPTFKLEDPSGPANNVSQFESWTETIGGVATKVYDYRVYETFWGVPNGAKFTEKGVVKDWVAQGWNLETIVGTTGSYGIRKYALDADNEGPTGLDPLWSDNNIRLIRLSDVMLLYAECLANLNPSNVTASDVNSAIYWVDQVRNRANAVATDQAGLYSTRAGVTGQLPTATALRAAKGWTLLQLIQHERYVEGYCEGWRREDMKRWQVGLSFVKAKTNWKGYQSLTLPVPQGELDNNPNFPKQ